MGLSTCSVADHGPAGRDQPCLIAGVVPDVGGGPAQAIATAGRRIWPAMHIDTGSWLQQVGGEVERLWTDYGEDSPTGH